MTHPQACPKLGHSYNRPTRTNGRGTLFLRKYRDRSTPYADVCTGGNSSLDGDETKQLCVIQHSSVTGLCVPSYTKMGRPTPTHDCVGMLCGCASIEFGVNHRQRRVTVH